jgi:ribbon-helix-helix CopG family protein
MTTDVKGVLTLVVPVALMAELDAEARQEGLTRSAHVRRIIARREPVQLSHFNRAVRELEIPVADPAATLKGHK